MASCNYLLGSNKAAHDLEDGLEQAPGAIKSTSKRKWQTGTATEQHNEY